MKRLTVYRVRGRMVLGELTPFQELFISHGVQFITHDWMTYPGHMNPQLMSPAGLRKQFDERISFFNRFNPFIPGNSILRLSAMNAKPVGNPGSCIPANGQLDNSGG